MAGKYGPPSAFLFVDGYDLTAAKLQTMRAKMTALQTPSHGLGDAAEEHSPVGVSRAELAQEGGFWSTAAGNIHEAMADKIPNTTQSAPRVVCFGFAGQTKGCGFIGFEGSYNNEYEVLAERDNLQKANASYVVSGKREPGPILQELAAKTGDWDTESTPVDHTTQLDHNRTVPVTSSSVANPSIITCPCNHGLGDGQKVLVAGHSGSTPDINGEHVATVITATTFSIPVDVTVGGTGGTVVQSNTIAGGAGYQHVIDFTGFTGFVGTIRDSADDITYADLLSFADVTSAPAKERKTVAGTVDRYLAYKGDVTGTGSITVFCGFSRF
jgi:hypothetical protein